MNLKGITLVATSRQRYQSGTHEVVRPIEKLRLNEAATGRGIVVFDLPECDDPKVGRDIARELENLHERESRANCFVEDGVAVDRKEGGLRESNDQAVTAVGCGDVCHPGELVWSHCEHAWDVCDGGQHIFQNIDVAR